MRFLRRPQTGSRSIAVFCGAFHPPTVAHVALAQAARERVDEVLWVMPEQLPHKQYEGVGLTERLQLLLETSADPVAVSSESLFFAIAAEAEAALEGCKIQLLTGEDGVKRIVEWNYGFDALEHGLFLENHFSRYPLLSIRRQEEWELPASIQSHVEWLGVDARYGLISATMVRERIAAGQEWEELVPESIRKSVARLYGSLGKTAGQ